MAVLERERKTIEAMILLYCCDHHGTEGELCHTCEELFDYAVERLGRCPYQEKKPTCSKCPIHCYKMHMRERIREVMRYAGPRMLRRHPVIAIRHLLNGLKRAPSRRDDN